MEMSHSVEGRLPFLDHHVVEMLRRVPSSLKIHEMNEKYVLREATADVLTDTIYKRQKHPFLAPPMTLRKGEPLEQLLQDTLRGASLNALPFYDQQEVVSLLDRLPEMQPQELVAWDSVLMSILSMCVLQDEFQLSSE
jgi:asparagine synthase (glutamine-hydrolysing)